MLGREEGQTRQIRLLNRIVTLENDCLTWEADPRHLEVLVETLGLQGKRGLKIPGVVDGNDGVEKKAARCKTAQELELNGQDTDGLDDEHGDGPRDNDEDGLGIGDEVTAEGHGRGRIAGKGCCGVRGCYEVCY